MTDQALESVVGLRAWQDLAHPGAGPALARESEDGIRASYAPGLDGLRERLRAGLGLPADAPAELIARLHAAQLRTDPGHVLLSSGELTAYELLDTLPRTALRTWSSLRNGRRATWAVAALRRGGARPASRGCRCSPGALPRPARGSAQRCEPGTTLKRTQTTSVSSSTACPTLRQ